MANLPTALMLGLLFGLLKSGSSAALPASAPLPGNTSHGRVMLEGGTEVWPFGYTFIVAVGHVEGENDYFYASNYYTPSVASAGPQMCHGSVIADDWVMTSGQCAKSLQENFLKRNLQVEVYRHDIMPNQGREHACDSPLKVRRVVVHEDFDDGVSSMGMNYRNDIGLVQLESTPVCALEKVILDDGTYSPFGSDATMMAVGWRAPHNTFSIGFQHYAMRQCQDRNELYTGQSTGLQDCAQKCTVSSECISFEYWPVGQEHLTHGANYCQTSSSCTYELSIPTSSSDPSDLYIKDGDKRRSLTHVADVPNTLAEVDVSLIPTMICADAYGYDVLDTFICAEPGKVDTDSGAPLFKWTQRAHNDHYRSRIVQVGIGGDLSYGQPPSGSGSGSGSGNPKSLGSLPGLFERVSAHIDWVKGFVPDIETPSCAFGRRSFADAIGWCADGTELCSVAQLKAGSYVGKPICSIPDNTVLWTSTPCDRKKRAFTTLKKKNNAYTTECRKTNWNKRHFNFLCCASLSLPF